MNKVKNSRLFSYVLFTWLVLLSCKKENDLFFLNNEKIERFSIMVNTTHPFLNDSNITFENDLGVLILPIGYGKNERPVKLIIYCHSGGGTVRQFSSEAESNEYTKYLVSLGYAVLGMAGMPESFSERLVIDHNRTLGSYVAVRSFYQGYKHVISKYNIDSTGCFLLCNSNGGLVSSNLVNLTDIPFIAQAGIAPLLSTEHNAWHIYSSSNSGGNFQYYQNRANIIRIFGMKNVNNQEELDSARYEKEKIRMYDPFDYNINISKLAYRVPYKIFHAVDDPLVLYKFSARFTEVNNKRGGNIILRGFDSGGHLGETDTTTIGYYNFMGKEHKLTPTLREVAIWFDLFSPITKESVFHVSN